MELILKEDIRALGKAGEVVKVSEGYGRNYLLPQKKAVVASKENMKTLERELKVIKAQHEKLKKGAQAISEKIQATSVVLEREVGEEGKLFGSVTARHISEALAGQGITVDHRAIIIKSSIREAGSYEVEVELHAEVVAPLKVEVRKK